MLDGDDAVDGADEIGVDGTIRDVQPAIVELAQLLGQRSRRQPRCFIKPAERRKGQSWSRTPARAILRNSSRSSAFDSYVPRQNVVRVVESLSRTPRICVQRCAASR